MDGSPVALGDQVKAFTVVNNVHFLLPPLLPKIVYFMEWKSPFVPVHINPYEGI